VELGRILSCTHTAARNYRARSGSPAKWVIRLATNSQARLSNGSETGPKAGIREDISDSFGQIFTKRLDRFGRCGRTAMIANCSVRRDLTKRLFDACHLHYGEGEANSEQFAIIAVDRTPKPVEAFREYLAEGIRKMSSRIRLSGRFPNHSISEPGNSSRGGITISPAT